MLPFHGFVDFKHLVWCYLLKDPIVIKKKTFFSSFIYRILPTAGRCKRTLNFLIMYIFQIHLKFNLSSDFATIENHFLNVLSNLTSTKRMRSIQNQELKFIYTYRVVPRYLNYLLVAGTSNSLQALNISYLCVKMRLVRTCNVSQEQWEEQEQE